VKEPLQRRVRTRTGLELSVLEWNAAAPHTIVLVHGFLDLAWGFSRLVEYLLASLGDVHILAPDMRGHGDSDRIGAGGYYHFFDYVPDLADVIAACAGPELTLVGHSMGGTIAAYFAATFPKRVTRLALLEGLGPPAGDVASPERTRGWIDAIGRVRDKPQRTYATLAETAQRLRANDPLLDETFALWLAEKSTLKTSDDRYRFKHDPLHVTRGPYPFSPDVGERFFCALTCPVLLVEGADSEQFITRSDIEQRASRIPRAERFTLPNAAHMMQRHQPQALAERLVRFVQSTPVH